MNAAGVILKRVQQQKLQQSTFTFVHLADAFMPSDLHACIWSDHALHRNLIFFTSNTVMVHFTLEKIIIIIKFYKKILFQAFLYHNFMFNSMLTAVSLQLFMKISSSFWVKMFEILQQCFSVIENLSSSHFT